MRPPVLADRAARSTESELDAAMRVIVVERGAPDLGAALASAEGGSNLVVHVQQPDDPASALVNAVAKSMHELKRCGRSLTGAALLLCGHAEAEARAGRALIAGLLVTRLAASGGGELELIAPAGEPLGSREDLLLLIEDLLQRCGSRPVTIRLRHAAKLRAGSSVRRAA